MAFGSSGSAEVASFEADYLGLGSEAAAAGLDSSDSVVVAGLDCLGSDFAVAPADSGRL